MSHREAQSLLGCSNKPVNAAFKELQGKGFIKLQQRGAFKGVPMASTWLLTELEQDEPIRSLSATKEFMRWKPDSKALPKKSPYAESVLTACPERSGKGLTVCPEHTDSVPIAHGSSSNSKVTSVPRARTYNLPCTEGSEANDSRTEIAQACPAEPKGRGSAARQQTNGEWKPAGESVAALLHSSNQFGSKE